MATYYPKDASPKNYTSSLLYTDSSTSSSSAAHHPNTTMMSFLSYASPSNSVLGEASIDLSAPSSMILSGSPMVDGLGSPLLQQSSQQGLSLSLSTQQRKIQPSSPATVINSRYLKVAQQLLDEVVNVRASSLKNKSDDTEMSPPPPPLPPPPQREDDGSKSFKQLSSIEREDLQNKMNKLLAMLDEVDGRYKQYHNQMQIVVLSFESIAGSKAAKPYTLLALQTISRHFRCLRDAINDQIQSTRRNLGEQEGSTMVGGGISRLRYIDQNLRHQQQRSSEHMSMLQMQQHMWRPQRGLPENSVSILRAWLFEHFLHPYPRDSDKSLLAQQTGLTRNQVSNWFINARVRLWKPMVEEMYKEETSGGEIDSNSNSKSNPNSNSNSNPNSNSNFSSENVAKKMKTTIERCPPTQSDSKGNDGLTGLQGAIVQADCTTTGDGGGSGGGGGVSLTLGLQHREGELPSTLSDGNDFHHFIIENDESDYGYIDLPNNRRRFEPSQLLHDFVA